MAYGRYRRTSRWGKRTSYAGAVAKKVARKTFRGLKSIARRRGVNAALKVAANKQGQTTWRAVKTLGSRAKRWGSKRRYSKRRYTRRY